MAELAQPLGRLTAGRKPAGRQAYIAAAALRCREYGLDPASPPRSEHIGGAALRMRHEALADLEAVTRPQMYRLFKELAGTQYVLLLTDANGTILDLCADDANAGLLAAAQMAPGFIWDERHEGTNGPGTCLHDRQPRVVHRDDHYFHSNRRMTCSAAPIWGPNGRLLGALDASRLDSSDSRASQGSTLAIVGLTARIIEQLYFARQFPGRLLIGLHDRPIAVNQPQDGLLAIGEDGRIEGADSAALDWLAAGEPTALIGRSAEELLEMPIERLFERAAAGSSAAWPFDAGRGRQRYASLIGTQGWRTAARMPAPQPRADRRPHRARPGEARRVRLVAPPGSDPQVAENVRRANLVMDRDIHILLQGETGTGKDTFARAIHLASERFDRPFIAVNCVAIPEALAESELFGYEPGAFTGARAQGMRGKVLAAHGGTLFLDEIGDMPLSLQARLLRLLEEKEVVPLGGSKPIPVDLNVISATHRDLREMVARGDFRMDLFYRLSGITLTLPPLRRRTDRKALIATLCREEANGAVDVDPLALAALMAYDWPGNIRELRNALRTAIAFAGAGRIELGHLPPELRCADRAGAGAAVAEVGNSDTGGDERSRIRLELERHHWRIGKTAAALGLSRNTLYRKLHRYGLMPS